MLFFFLSLFVKNAYELKFCDIFFSPSVIMKNTNLVTEEEAKQLAKVLSSVKHMELHTNAKCMDRLSGSTRSPRRNARNTVGLSSLMQPASAGGSFMSKGRFLEMKDGTGAELSAKVGDGATSILKVILYLE